ncbi:hypothetical protein V3N99_05205 [Dermatophilaceae bacterium Soc4.6]
MTLSIFGAIAPSVAAPATTTLPAGPALSLTADTSWWGTNGRVDDIVSDGSSAWIAGGFDYVGPTTGRGVLVDTATGAKLSGDSVRVDDPVRAAVPDGVGGYYLAGSFVRVGTVRRDGLVHIAADGKIDRSFAPKLTGSVFTMARVGDVLVVGGDFTAVNGTTASRLAAIGSDGQLVPGWYGATNGPVYSLAVAGDSVYAGGSFSTADGASRGNLARFTLSNGALESFNPRTNAAVRAIDLIPGSSRDSDSIIVGGDFTSVSTWLGYPRNHVAVVSGNSSLSSWAPDVNGAVSSLQLTPDGTSFAVGGSFTSVDNTSRTGVAQIATGGSVLPFDAQLAGCQLPHVTKNANQYVPCSTDVSTVGFSDDGSTLYVGGLFTTTQGVVRHDAASYDLTSGAVTAWAPMPSARVRAMLPLPGGVVLGGDFTSVGGLYRQGLAKIDLATGQADPSFRADTDNLIVDIELDATKQSLYAGGSFRTVNGLARNKVVKVSAATGAVDPAFRQGANKDVYSLAVRGDSVYLGGIFTKIGQVTRMHAAKVSAVTGAADPSWVVNTTGGGGAAKGGGVFSVAVTADASRVFLAGGFNNVNGSGTTGGIIAVDGATGAVNPSRLGGVEGCASTGTFIIRLYLSDDGQRLYGGDICPDRIYQWDAVNLAASRTDGLLWKSWCNGGMQGRLEVNGHFYYGSHGGDKGSGGRCWASPANHTDVAQQRYMVFDAAGGSLLDYAPTFDTPMGVWAFASVPGGMLVGGDFFIAGDRHTQQQGLAFFRGTP